MGVLSAIGMSEGACLIYKVNSTAFGAVPWRYKS